MAQPTDTGELTAFRGGILHFPDSLAEKDRPEPEFWTDGLMVVSGGKVLRVGDHDVLASDYPGLVPRNCEGSLIMPGFIDTHIHYPQSAIVASYAGELLDWLHRHTFPEEAAFGDPETAYVMATFFLKELFRHGTTAAQVYGSSHKQSVEAFFRAAELTGARMLCGKVMMDRHAPEALLDTVKDSENDCRTLIEDWQGRARLGYVVTPRFAITSTPEQLAVAGRLLEDYPDVWFQTHLAENPAEVDWVRQLFPGTRDYLDVYDQAGLLGPRSTFAHALHLSERELSRLQASGSRVAFCPTSNCFLGSGLLNVARLESLGVQWGLATDVGAGTSFSMLQTLSEAYKVCRLQGQALDPIQAFYRITLGNARALNLQHEIGNLAPGKHADFVVLDLEATPLQALRQTRSNSLQDRLFGLMMLGDDRSVRSTYVAGRCVWERPTT